MSLFGNALADSGYDRTFNPPTHDEDGCFSICHKRHLEEKTFDDDCEYCATELCYDCRGRGVVDSLDIDGWAQMPCASCKGTGLAT